jgi:hypothetical protein
MIRHSSVDWMMRHLIVRTTPELAHLRVGAALCGPNARRKYSAI